MITIFFPSGAFGSTLEFVIRNYSNEFKSINADILNNGSMHSFEKEFHPYYLEDLNLLRQNNYGIITPVWPGLDMLEPKEYIKRASQILSKNKVIFVYFKNREQYELNELFAYHKLPNYLQNTIKNYKQWNKDYNSLNDMSKWEVRESLSLRMTHSLYLDTEKESCLSWLKITPFDILFDFKNLLPKIFDYLNLSLDVSQNFSIFYDKWFTKQQYILKEYELIQEILSKFEKKLDMCWEGLSIAGEAIIQSRMLSYGYEIQCFRLNTFPTNISNLNKLLIPIKKQVL